MITIVTTTYNSEKFISYTLQSIRDAVGFIDNYEHIVIDAGSTDCTKEIVDSFSFSKWISLEKSTMYEAIHYGFKRAKGDIICWLNSDDILYKNTLIDVQKYFEKNPEINAVTGNCNYIDDQGRIMYPYYFKTTSKTFLTRYNYLFICQPATFWKKNIYEEIGGLNLNYSIVSDRDFFCRLVQRTKLYKMNKILCGFRVHDENLSITKRELATMENKLINVRLNIGQSTIFDLIISSLGSVYNKICNPRMIIWKIKNRRL